MIIDMYVCDAVIVIRELPAERPLVAITSYDNRLYVLYARSVNQVEEYDLDDGEDADDDDDRDFYLLRSLTVPGLHELDAYDIVACGHNRCAYISDDLNECVRRLALTDGTVTQWPLNDVPACLSLTARFTVLVTFIEVRKIKEFTTNGELLHELTLPEEMVTPTHSIQLSSGEYLVCHGDIRDPLHRVCLIDAEGRPIRSFGGPPGSGNQQLNTPVHMAVDRNGFVFVADLRNHRVMLLSPVLTYVRTVNFLRETVPGYRPRVHGPAEVHFDSDRRLLFVVDTDRHHMGQVVVVTV